jgi:hypothetical protein
MISKKSVRKVLLEAGITAVISDILASQIGKEVKTIDNNYKKNDVIAEYNKLAAAKSIVLAPDNRLIALEESPFHCIIDLTN